MGGIDLLTGLSGTWDGPNRLWLRPTEAPHESQSTATVLPVIGGRFVRIDYTWAYQGEPQEGSLLVGYETEDDVVTAVWTDSWHMGDKLMVCRGVAEASGSVDVRGSYAVQSGPDWGWRTVIRSRDDGTFVMIMYNITPEGTEALAVEAVYTRAAPR
ncbi:MAG: DUF1579 family protein [Acidobacteriota bacterium]